MKSLSERQDPKLDGSAVQGGDLSADLGAETEPLSRGVVGLADSLLPGLTILYHPDLNRIGELTTLPILAAGGEQALSRREPDFHPPGSASRGPLADRRLSRRPAIFSGTADGGVLLKRDQCPVPVRANGETITDQQSFSRTDLESGVVLFFGERVVLLLHLLEALSETEFPSYGLIGQSRGIQQIRRGIRQTADLRTSVLIRGETGVGKELVARAVHEAGRSDGPLVTVNMAAIPPSLAAAELFGAERGAFTGADRRRAGYFRAADGGTLFLDEVGDTPVEVQPLLLRALETGEIQPVGGGEAHSVDVRVISATDRDLESAVAKDETPFRVQLLHRLSGFVLQVPPLRHRREDLGLLFRHFLELELSAVGEPERLHSMDTTRPWLPPSLAYQLALHSWPGNVRQLRNVVRHLVIAHRGMDRVPVDFPLKSLLGSGSRSSKETGFSKETGSSKETVPRSDSQSRQSKKRKASEITDDELVTVLRAQGWRLQRAADELGIPRSSLYELIDRHPQIRKASELDVVDIQNVSEQCGGDVDAMAERLEVSARALRRRMGQLGLSLS